MFVSPQKFKALTSALDRSACDITEWSLKGMKTGHDVFTEAVRSCTCASTSVDGNLHEMVHIQDTPTNLSQLQTIVNKLTEGATNAFEALVIGAKDIVDYKKVFDKSSGRVVKKPVLAKESKPIFEGIEKPLEQSGKVAYFEGHSPQWQTSVYHSDKDKTWYICTSDIENPCDYVKNEPDIGKVFEHYSVPNKDQLAFEAVA